MQANATADAFCPKCHSGVIDRGGGEEGGWMPWEKALLCIVCALLCLFAESCVHNLLLDKNVDLLLLLLLNLATNRRR